MKGIGITLGCLCLALSGCGGWDGGASPNDDAPDDGVAQAAQPLGGFRVRWSLEDRHYSQPLHLGATFAIFYVPETCANLRAVNLLTSVATTIPLPGCEPPDAIGSDATTVVVSQSGPTPGLRAYDMASSTWSEIAPINHWGRGENVLLQDSYIYYADDDGIWRLGRSGQSGREQLSTLVPRRLHAVDRGTLYFETASQYLDWYDLLSVTTSGRSARTLHSSQVAHEDFSLDATYLYWVDSGPERVTRLSRKSLELSTAVKSKEGVSYHHPRSTGSALYWMEQSAELPLRVRRRNLVNGNVVSVDYDYDGGVDPSLPHVPWFMNVDGDWMYLLQLEHTGAPLYREAVLLIRGSR